MARGRARAAELEQAPLRALARGGSRATPRRSAFVAPRPPARGIPPRRAAPLRRRRRRGCRIRPHHAHARHGRRGREVGAAAFTADKIRCCSRGA